MRLRMLKSIIITGIVLILPTLASARKVAVSGGLYRFSAENASNKVVTTLSGIGSYQIAYRQAIMQQFEVDVGYSLLATDAIGGDISFGFDIGANYYPMTNAGAIELSSELGSMVLMDQWRPFVGISFNQRNFQSTSSQYAGFGVKGGTEYQFDERYSLQATARYLSLGGPNQSKASQIDFLTGIAVQF
jgi:hypothetical protein